MSSKRDSNPFKGTPNSPNPAKFLREMSVLVPKLQAAGHIGPANREQARAKGEQSAVKYKAKTAMEQMAEMQRRTNTIAWWFDEKMKEHAPTVFGWVKKYRKNWIFLACGYSMNAHSAFDRVEGIDGVPCTICTIKRFWWIVAAERLIWAEPEAMQEPEKPKPKSRIITDL